MVVVKLRDRDKVIIVQAKIYNFFRIVKCGKSSELKVVIEAGEE